MIRVVVWNRRVGNIGRKADQLWWDGDVQVASLWPAPQVKQEANGSIVTYYFVNATIVCAKYEGVGFKSLSWVKPLPLPNAFLEVLDVCNLSAPGQCTRAGV